MERYLLYNTIRMLRNAGLVSPTTRNNIASLVSTVRYYIRARCTYLAPV